MVDSISNNGPVSTLLRAQQATLAGLNQNQQNSQKLIDQQSNGARPAIVQQPVKTAGASGELPRGSLVDMLA